MTTPKKADLISSGTAREIEPLRAELHSLTTDELRDRLASQLQLTADHMLRTAMIVRELEERGEDLSDLKLGLLPYLRRIAHGQVVPELVVRYAGFPALIQRLANFPLPEQRRIAAGEPIELLVFRGDETDTRMVDPLHLTRDQLYQVFAANHVRTAPEQAAFLEDFRRRPKVAKKPKKSRVRADAARGGIVVGRSFAPVDEVLAALADLGAADYDDDLDGEATLVVKLSEAEHRQLKVRAAKGNSSMARLVRRALAAAGLIGRPEEEV